MTHLFGIALIMVSIVGVLSAQNCAGLLNVEILNIAKQMDLQKLEHVIIKRNSIVAKPGFKFVQLRDTETFILVPEQYQVRFIDFQELLSNSIVGTFALDGSKMTGKITCVSGFGYSSDCKHQRISKIEIGCPACSAVKWISASSFSDKSIIIPPYRPT